jgi:predicted N-acetyltransferase YhbS
MATAPLVPSQRRLASLRAEFSSRATRSRSSRSHDSKAQALKELRLGLAAAEPARMVHFVAWKGSSPVGMASAFFAGETVLLASLAVPPSERRQGVGSALTLARLKEAAARGCDLAVLAPTPDGAELYEALGFEHHPLPRDHWFYLPVAGVA